MPVYRREVGSIETANLKKGKLAVGAEILVERNRLVDSQPLHDNEAERVAQRVQLVLVRPDQRDRFLFIVLAEPDQIVSIGVNRVQKSQDRLAAWARATK